MYAKDRVHINNFFPQFLKFLFILKRIGYYSVFINVK